jgi:adenylosuccinate synthase
MTSLVLLSGAVCAGKTTLADCLRKCRAAEVLTTRALIAAQASNTAEYLDRRRFQQLGDDLDRRTGGGWVADAVKNMGLKGLIVVDAVRTSAQIDAIKANRGALHVHLTAQNLVLENRYAQRTEIHSHFELPTFAALREDPTEASIEHLAALADLVIDTARHDRQATLMLTLSALNI